MNRRLLLFLVPFLIVFSGCAWSGYDVASLSFFTNNGTVSPSYYAETSLVIVPDYELRTFEVSYVVIYPHRMEETDAQDVDSEGIVGGEFFDRFEEVLDVLFTGGARSLGKEELIIEGAGIFVVRLEDAGGVSEEYDFAGDLAEEGIDVVGSFYDDVIHLFSEDVY